MHAYCIHMPIQLNVKKLSAFACGLHPTYVCEGTNSTWKAESSRLLRLVASLESQSELGRAKPPAD